MATEEQIRATLAQVIVPQAERSLVQLNLVQEIKIEQGKVSVRLAAAGLAPDVQEYITAGVRAVLSKARVKNVDVEYTEAKAADLNKVKRVIAIMSGKGGVGKSAVACLTAISLRRRDL